MGHFSAATGSNLDMPIMFTNAGKGACVVQGFPDITVLDSRGATLARAVGSEGRGTYFDDGPAVAILVRPGAQAFVNFTWYDCRNPLAARLGIDLPANGGRLLIPFAVKGNYYMLCDSDRNFSALSRGPFSPVGIDWPPGPTLIPVALTIDAPAKVKAGSTLVYYVTLGNQSPQDYVLTPCPDYVELLGPKVVALNYALNCASVARVAAGRSMTFQMEMAIPKTVQPASYLIQWALSDGRIASVGVTTSVDVTS